ncbi:shikimate dehydrogenase [Desulfotomaculum sp. 1211_IL3151]|uniref:shikimate dehydrogenase n=1 Tax=Desulfotomaculum sp. 1211_IL3151 TaxID=3084055 RepID=UPI002FD8DB8F
MEAPKINGSTRVCGLFGYPVEHSFSPAMHNEAFGHLGLNWVYLPFLVHTDHIKQAVDSIVSLNIVGVNVTVPHKQSVLPFLDELEPAAKLIGAVNTIVNHHGKLIGYNTDGRGFVQSLASEANFQPRGKRAILIGVGGAARAVAIQLALAGVKALDITNRSQEKAAALACQINQAAATTVNTIPWESNELEQSVATADLVIQATSLGMAPQVDQVPPFPFQALTPQHLVCDLIYNPDQTRFLREAAAQGSRTMNGLGMLLYQGVLAFQLWTGLKAPVEIMRQGLQQQLAKIGG